MIRPEFDASRVSTDVQLHLIVGDAVHPLSHLGPYEVVLRTPVDYPPGQHAEVVMIVDGESRRWNVLLPFGALESDPNVLTQRIAD